MELALAAPQNSRKEAILKGLERSGLLYAQAGFVVLSMGDVVVKTMAGLWAPTAVASLRFAMGAFGLGVLLLARHGLSGFSVPHPKVQLLRGAGLALATAGFFSAIYVMPLATAAAITFTSPMITAFLAALFLGEPLRRETAMATLIAFAGVLIVLRPNFAALGWVAFLPLVAAAGMSMLMIGNRFVAGKASPLLMQFLVAAIAAPLLLIAAIGFHHSGIPGSTVSWPEWSVVVRCALIACTASFAHWLLFLATTRAGAATIAPMTYIQLLIAIVAGWALFGDHPDGTTLAGSAMIIAAGLYLWRANPAGLAQRS